jgi:hypothetical protein
MTDRDLTTLLERASAELPELDFAEAAWADALTIRLRRRRRAAGLVATVAVVGVIATVVQLGGSPTPRPVPLQPSTTTQGVRHLPDGTAYATLPQEGTESELPTFQIGLPSTINTAAGAMPLSEMKVPPESVVAVVLREVGSGYQPVLVTGDGREILVDKVHLTPTNDGASIGVPLGVRAFGAGHYIVFAQPRAVVMLDTQTGAVRRFSVPSATLFDAAWTADRGPIIARSPTGAWEIDPWSPGQVVAKPIDAASFAGQYRLSAAGGLSGPRIAVTSQDRSGALGKAVSLKAPVTDIWGETMSNEDWAAAGAFLDQNAVYPVIRRGFGPIYQGVVAARADGRAGAQLLLAPESPDGQTGRFKGCCSVLGWADGNTVLLRTYGSHGVWVLAWTVSTGAVYEVSRLGPLSGSGFPTAIALNVGWRS